MNDDINEFDEWIHRTDYNKLRFKLEVAVKALEDTETRLKALKNSTCCIGSEKVHVDFNCTHCLVQYSKKKVDEALLAITERSSDEK